MVRTIHNEFDAFRNSAKLPDNQSIAKEFVVVRNMVFKSLGATHIIIVGVFANDDIRPGNNILDKYNLLNTFVRIYAIRVWPHNLTPSFLSKVVYHIHVLFTILTMAERAIIARSASIFQTKAYMNEHGHLSVRTTDTSD